MFEGMEINGWMIQELICFFLCLCPLVSVNCFSINFFCELMTVFYSTSAIYGYVCSCRVSLGIEGPDFAYGSRASVIRLSTELVARRAARYGPLI